MEILNNTKYSSEILLRNIVKIIESLDEYIGENGSQ